MNKSSNSNLTYKLIQRWMTNEQNYKHRRMRTRVYVCVYAGEVELGGSCLSSWLEIPTEMSIAFLHTRRFVDFLLAALSAWQTVQTAEKLRPKYPH